VFQRLIDAGRLGRKSGRGFYDYSGEKKHPDLELYDLLGWQPRRISDQEIIERCVLRMMDETARAMDIGDGDGGVIEDPRAVDIGVVFGLGFPPFRGGILREIDRLGAEHVVERLRYYADQHGERFRPAPLLVRRAQMEERFYPAGAEEGDEG
jgi:3-hydroxyacyl-CoA dehydrogenase/enoyl-CoA hydratase/3-hydroxybutyryl-CoA epimerase